MFNLINFFKSLIQKRREAKSHIEELRLKMIQHKVKDICEQRLDKELNDPCGYDVKASCHAIHQFKTLALNIDAKTSKKYMKILNDRVEDAQKNCSFRGEYSGGVATYGSLQSSLYNWYEEKLIRYSLTDLVSVSDSKQ